jgi:excisionase family DNA binding protein
MRKRARRTDTPAKEPAAPRQTISINEFCQLASVSRMTVWRMISRGEIEAISVGAKRLILIDSWHHLIERRLAEQGR